MGVIFFPILDVAKKGVNRLFLTKLFVSLAHGLQHILHALTNVIRPNNGHIVFEAEYPAVKMLPHCYRYGYRKMIGPILGRNNVMAESVHGDFELEIGKAQRHIFHLAAKHIEGVFRPGHHIDFVVLFLALAVAFQGFHAVHPVYPEIFEALVFFLFLRVIGQQIILIIRIQHIPGAYLIYPLVVALVFLDVIFEIPEADISVLADGTENLIHIDV